MIGVRIAGFVGSYNLVEMNLFPHSKHDFSVENELLEPLPFSIVISKWIPAYTNVYGKKSIEIRSLLIHNNEEGVRFLPNSRFGFDDEMHALIKKIYLILDLIYTTTKRDEI